MRFLNKYINFFFLVFLIVTICTGFASAATINVNNSTSNSLKNAITNANSGDTLNLSAGTYYVHDLMINKNLTIIGPTVTGATLPKAIIDGQNLGRIFTVNTGVKLTLNYLTLQNGNATKESADQNGGAIYNNGTLNINHCYIQKNTAYSGGAFYNNNGTVNLNQCNINHNNATEYIYKGIIAGQSGAFYNNNGTVNIIQTAINFNSGHHDSIMYNGGTITVSGSATNPAWKSEIVDAPGSVGQATSLALDKNNNPHILYYDYYVNSWKYAYKNNGIWYTETFDNATSDYNKISPNSIALDSSGNPYIIYPSPEGLKYAYKKNGKWYKEIVDSNGGTYSSIALDSKGNPHISYVLNGAVYYRFRSDWGWSGAIAVDSDSNSKYFTSIRVDKQDNAHIAYLKGGTGVIYASQGGIGFHSETAYSGGQVICPLSRCLSLALDSSGNPHITFWDIESSGTYFVYINKDTAWHYQVLDPPLVSDNSVGYYNSIAVDSQGNPHICYWCEYGDAGNFGETSLRYLTQNSSGNWTTPTIVDTITTQLSSTGPYYGIIGKYCSIALDSNGNPCISYYDGVNGNLMYIYLPETVPPVVKSIDPINNAVNVPANKTIKVTFSENIKAGNMNITLKNNSGTAISINKSISGNILTITPTTNLTESLYTLNINTGAITDLVDNPVAQTITKFSTGNSPTITTSNPANNKTKVARNQTITITFNEAIQAGSNYNKITLKASNGTTITIKKSINGKVLTIIHSAKLAANTKYTLTIYSSSITDLAANPLIARTITFTTGNT